MCKYVLILYCIVCCQLYAAAQAVLQGRVVDATTGEVMLFSNVVLYTNNVLVTGTETDIDGQYIFTDLDPGVYTVEASYVGYSPLKIENIELVSNSNTVLDLSIGEANEDPFITIRAPFHIRTSPRSFTIHGRHTQLPGNFDDPSRSLIRFPGFANGNDQANGIIYHGLPADMIKWTIDGAEIINPNHLANAGTLSDQSSASSGGVLAISQEMMDKFEFSATPYEAHQNNAIAGIADIQPIDPNKQQAFIKLGLLGLESAYTDKKVAAHYRYSTVGLLGNLGLDFGGEKIVFQDLFVKYRLWDNDKNSLSATTILGRSSNDKKIIDDLSLAQEYKDLQEIHYQSDIAIMGLTHSGKYDRNKWTTNNSLFYSTHRNQRSERLINQTDSTLTINNLSKIAYTGSIHREGKYLRPTAGIQVIHNHHNDARSTTLIYPNIGLRHLSNKWILETQLGTQVSAFGSQSQVDILGSVDVSYPLVDGLVGLSLSKQSQQYIHDQRWTQDLIHTLGGSIYAQYRPDDMSFWVNGFYQRLTHLPFGGNGISAIDGQDFLTEIKHRDGQARTYGVDIKIDKTFADYTYLTISTTLFNIQKKSNEEAPYIAGAYDYGYIVSGSLSRLFLKRVNIHLGFTYRGGEQSYLPNIPTTVDGPIIYDEQTRLSPYLRADMRLRYSFDRSELVLDIQNLTNRQNDAYYFYDRLTERVTLKKQLGIIPILSWKYNLIEL